MIAMHISHTSRTPHPSSRWTITDEREETFADMPSALAYLKHEYFYCKKRVPCYQDTKSRGTVQSGWIYCFKERENGKTYYCQHWVSLYDVEYRVVDVAAYHRTGERSSPSPRKDDGCVNVECP